MENKEIEKIVDRWYSDNYIWNILDTYRLVESYDIKEPVRELLKEHTKDTLPISHVIKRLEEMLPNIELKDFDKSKENDPIYCVEWGIHKGQHQEQLVMQRFINELKNLKP